VRLAGTGARPAEAAPVPDDTPAPVEEARAEKPTEAEREAPVVAEEAPEDAAPAETEVEESESGDPAVGKKSSAEIARIFKDRFDGEIIEKTKEGKD